MPSLPRQVWETPGLAAQLAAQMQLQNASSHMARGSATYDDLIKSVSNIEFTRLADGGSDDVFGPRPARKAKREAASRRTEMGSKLFYLDNFPGLPSNASADHPHLIDCSDIDGVNFERENVQIADAVVTTLYHYSPEALEEFLSLSSGKIAYFIWESGSFDIMNSIIARRGHRVLVSLLLRR
jgi:hypothetical protein